MSFPQGSVNYCGAPMNHPAALAITNKRVEVISNPYVFLVMTEDLVKVNSNLKNPMWEFGMNSDSSTISLLKPIFVKNREKV
jgi:hypothetical protein